MKYLAALGLIAALTAVAALLGWIGGRRDADRWLADYPEARASGLGI